MSHLAKSRLSAPGRVSGKVHPAKRRYHQRSFLRWRFSLIPRWPGVLLAVFAALVAGAGGPARGDTLIKNSGEQLNGKVISEDDKSILYEVHMEGLVARVTVPLGEIRTLQRDTIAGPGYYPLPIEGEIGSEVTAASLEDGIKQARLAKPDFVVLFINSPGGSITEMFKIVQVIRDAKDLRFVAYVDRAISAAGIVALSCPRLYMSENGTIGAALPWKLGPDGTPQEIESKFRSAFAGEVRGLAESAGHSGLLASGMIEPDLELALTTKNDKPYVIELGPNGPPRGAILLKKKGGVLTLTGKEALACGLAAGNAASIADLGKIFGPGVWHKVDDLGWNSMKHQAALARKQGERNAYLRSVAPELERIRAHVEQSMAQANGAVAGLDSLQKDHDAELAVIEKKYQDTIKAMPAGEDKQAWAARAAQTHDAAVATLEDKYKQPVADLQQKYRAAKAECEQAKTEYNTMLAAGP